MQAQATKTLKLFLFCIYTSELMLLSSNTTYTNSKIVKITPETKHLPVVIGQKIQAIRIFLNFYWMMQKESCNVKGTSYVPNIMLGIIN